jgi:hypothetical protein
MFFIFLVGGSKPLHVLQFQLLAISLVYLSKLGVTMVLQWCYKVLQLPNAREDFFIFIKKYTYPLKYTIGKNI